ncbi:MAG TPA: methyltransferase domain-containing protein [Candidatus Dormibacteraeota bacterium]|nr:methyltransferase domain-containing protein [Candidatus Dormibacteraeota bacterium]
MLDDTLLEPVRDLLARFLANRTERTLQAYRIDVDDFGRFREESPAEAVASLLRGGPSAAAYQALEFAIELRRRGRAPATVNRRLSTLRSVVAAAREAGIVDWALDIPREEEVAAATVERAGQASYLLPRHPSEVDRLDLQHYALCAALRATHLAPVHRPARALDVGSGTGQWGFDVVQQFPDALVVGYDLVAGKPGGPPGHRWVRGNLLDGLPFADGSFDFVHQRLLVTGIPLSEWPTAVAELVRVTRPGGWVELVEPRMTFERAAPATEQLLALTMGHARSLGLDTASVVFGALDGHLRDAGLVEVVREQLDVPIGRWGGDVGSLMATDVRAGFTRVCEVLQARSLLPVGEGRGLIERAQEEWERNETSWTFAIAYGRRPSA